MAAPQPRRRLIFIVSRERMDLYDSLRKALFNEADCEVILDRREGERRLGDRRGGDAPAGKDRRASHRRERIPVDAEIRECGWTVVKVSTWPEADAPLRPTT
ncbi:MAG TPA: hypothetical protein VGT02_04085 [Methylomirabilota bacterium]|nr:hypothetical protein [Methylomirabilota bacterium]